jgi:TrmH family RNA methyltransferase
LHRICPAEAMMLNIESAQNATYKKLLSLTSAKGLKAEKLFLLSGEKLIREFLHTPHLEIAFEILGPRMVPLAKKTKTIQMSAGLFAGIDVLGTHYNILVLEQPKVATISDISSHAPHGIEVVLPVGDPGNLGALIRSCEAFAVPRVILAKEAAHPFLPKTVKASAGSVLRVPLMRGPALAEFSESCIALDSRGTPIGDFKWPAKGMLVVGEEGAGFGKKNKFRKCISIPTKNVESLNAVVAASIALYKIREDKT